MEGEDSVQGGNNRQLESTLARMANFFDEQRNKWNGNERNPNEVPDDVALERFQKFKPPTFDGEKDEEVAEKWLQSLEKIYMALSYSEDRKVTFGAFQLEGAAAEWWRVISEKWETAGSPRLWSAFREEFRKQFVPKVVRDQKEEEFISLRQRSLTVGQYEVQFTKLSRYAPEMVNTEEKRKRRFLQGLNVELQRTLVSANMPTYADMVDFARKAEECEGRYKDLQNARRTARLARGGASRGQEKPDQEGKSGLPQKRTGGTGAHATAKRGPSSVTCYFCGKSGHREAECWRKAGKCLICGSQDHRINNCPRIQATGTQSAPNTVTGRGRPAAGERPRVAVRTYAIDGTETGTEPEVAKDTLPI